jgi:hypothetical protein
VTEEGSGLAGVVISGLSGDPNTNASGDYSADIDHGWSGTAVPTLTGYTFDPEQRSYADVTSDTADQNYTAAILTFTISGVVQEGETGVQDVVMDGLPGNPVTNVSGQYSSTVEYGWSGTVNPSHDDYIIAPENRTYSSIDSDQPNQDYLAEFIPTYTISGKVTSEGLGLESAEITGLPGNPVTNGSGDYSDSVQEGWSGTAAPVLPGYIFDPESRTYSSVESNLTSQDYTAEAVCILSGSVTESGTGLSNVVLNGLPGNPVTEGSGNFEAVVSSGWSGVIAPAHSGYVFTPGLRQYSNIVSDQINQDFTAAANSSIFAVSGTVTNVTGISGVVLNGLAGNVTTGETGFYYGTVSGGWSGVAVPVLSGYSFYPEFRQYTNVGADQESQDYTAEPDSSILTISGSVTDSGLGLIGVVLNGLPGNVTTGPAGSYAAAVSSGWAGNAIPVYQGYDFSPSSSSYSNVISNLVQDYIAVPNSAVLSISGTVTCGASGLPDVVLSGLPNGVTTGVSGYYYDTVTSSWSGTVTPVLSGYNFDPGERSYLEITVNQTDQNYMASTFSVCISGNVTYEGSGLSYVYLSGFPETTKTDYSGSYCATVDVGWSGVVHPYKSGFLFTPAARYYAGEMEDKTGQNYEAGISYNPPSSTQVLPEAIWAPASGGGVWMTDVQIIDRTGGSVVSVYFTPYGNNRRGPFVLWTGPGENRSIKYGNILEAIDGLDNGFDYYAKVGTVEFVTQDSNHKIHIMARTSNGDYSKTFQGLPMVTIPKPFRD